MKLLSKYLEKNLFPIIYLLQNPKMFSNFWKIKFKLKK